MNHVIAKIKGRKKNKIFKLLSDQCLFDSLTINIDACTDYDPDHNLDEDSWFKIEQFSQKEYCINLLKKDFDSKEYNNLHKASFSEIIYLCSVQNDDFYFQKVTPSLFLNRKMISFGEHAEVENSYKRLVINSRPDAVYFKKNDILVFKNLATISSIFKGIVIIYKVATAEEVRDFLKEPFIFTSNGFSEEKVSKSNRKRIALAMNTLERMSEEDRYKILGYIDNYCNTKLEIDPNGEKVNVSNDEELKLLLYGIEQRFYTTPFGGEKRLANSVKQI